MASNKIASLLVPWFVLRFLATELVEHFYRAGIFLFLFFHAVRQELTERNDYFLYFHAIFNLSRT